MSPIVETPQNVPQQREQPQPDQSNDSEKKESAASVGGLI
jgi:hypothetical protein